MSSSPIDAGRTVLAAAVRFSEEFLSVELRDGRSLSVPLGWFPRLVHGSATERENWRLIGGGEGIHWPDLDEDINVEDLLAGRRSNESRQSLERWLASRGTAPQRGSG